jgi:hypothetical protein
MVIQTMVESYERIAILALGYYVEHHVLIHFGLRY